VGGRKRGVDGENDALKEDKKKKLSCSISLNYFLNMNKLTRIWEVCDEIYACM
jgi:hypothetical protein